VADDAPEGRGALTRLDGTYPSGPLGLDRSSSALLSQHNVPGFVPRTIKLLRQSQDPAEQLHYLFVLRDVREGWNDETRRAYFLALSRAHDIRGGAGMPGFLKRISEEALATVEEPERATYAALLERDAAAAPDVPTIEQRAVVQQWTMAELEPALSEAHAPDFTRGRAMFHAAHCARCHRMGDEGGVTGPDLTNLASRFDRKAMLESVIHPSRVVDEQFRSVVIETADGRAIVGRIVQAGDYRESELRIAVNPLDPSQDVTILKKTIVSYRPTELSPMPEGLLSTLKKSEILDLLAFLESGGNAKHPVYKK
jgi:hypothetical protein